MRSKKSPVLFKNQIRLGSSDLGRPDTGGRGFGSKFRAVTLPHSMGSDERVTSGVVGLTVGSRPAVKTSGRCRRRRPLVARRGCRDAASCGGCGPPLLSAEAAEAEAAPASKMERISRMRVRCFVRL